MLKSTSELVVEFIQRIGKKDFFFKTKGGRGCYGEVEEVHEDYFPFEFLRDWEEEAHACGWERVHRGLPDTFGNDDDDFSFKVPIHEVDLAELFYYDEQTCLWMHACWQPDQQAWIETESRHGDISMPDWRLKLIAESPAPDCEKLKLVGWWQSEDEPYYPHPKYLVDPDWRKDDRDRIVGYLNGGHRGSGWLGSSYCRFGCFHEENLRRLQETLREGGVSESEIKCLQPGGEFLWTSQKMGSANRSDGRWVWPEGLAHYVERHDVCLPEEFVENMERNSWLAPQPEGCPSVSDHLYWIEWALEYMKHCDKGRTSEKHETSTSTDW